MVTRVGIAAAAVLCAVVAIGVAHADEVSGGNARVSFRGWITPHKLPRDGAAPVSLHIAGEVHPLGGGRPAGLERVRVEINRHGIVSTRGLSICPRRALMGTTTEGALERCRDALVGTGHFTAHVEIPEGSPFPAAGRLLVFNSSLDGHRALVGQVFGTRPAPVSQVLPIKVQAHGTDGFGATLTVQMPHVGHEWGYVTGFEVTFHRSYRYRGRLRSFLTASCPAPAGIGEAPFRAARGTYYLAGGKVLSRVVSGSCSVRPAPGG